MKSSFVFIGVLAVACALSSCDYPCGHTAVRSGYYRMPYDYTGSNGSGAFSHGPPAGSSTHFYGGVSDDVTLYHGRSYYRRTYDLGSAAANPAQAGSRAPATVRTWTNRYLGVSHDPGNWGAPVMVITQTSMRTPLASHGSSSSSALTANQPRGQP